MKTKKLSWLLWAICWLPFTCLVAQNEPVQTTPTADLDAERHKYLKKINDAQRHLENNQHEQKESLSKLNALKHQLDSRKEFITELQNAILSYEEQIKDREVAIYNKDKELSKLRDEYAAVIKAYAAKESVWAKMVLSLYFSSKDVSELLSRKEYYEQYLRRRKIQIDDIKHKTELLKKEQDKLHQDKAAKDEVLKEKLEQNEKFEDTQAKYNYTLSKLKHQALQLNTDIERSKKALAEMDKIAQQAIKKNNTEAKRKEIEDFVRIENEKALANAVKKSPTTVKENKENKENTRKKPLFMAFAETKHNLRWPVSSGYISGKFGVYQHPVYPKINLENHGIDIRTQNGEKVMAVFAGEVVAVNIIQGVGTLVMVQHGEYYTVYGKLENAKVRVGEKVKEGENIGSVGKNADGYPELQFQIWKGLQRINPEDWLEANQ